MGSNLQKIIIMASLISGVVTQTYAINNGNLILDNEPIKPYLVKIIRSDGRVCSRTYLNKNTILTAAHCLVKHHANLNIA